MVGLWRHAQRKRGATERPDPTLRRHSLILRPDGPYGWARWLDRRVAKLDRLFEMNGGSARRYSCVRQ
jgi:hypothetical protein